jgi:hypothetical protein
MRRILKTIALFAILITGMFTTSGAQDVWKGGSAYSHFGLGMPHDFKSSFASGMGVYGVALHDTRIPGMANPAAWSRAIFTNASGAVEIRSFDATSSHTEYRSTQFQTGPFQVVMPITRDRLGVTFSISPLTSSRFTLQNQYSLAPGENHSGSDLNYVVQNSGSGGINKLELGFGYRITNNFSVGYAPSLLLGNIQRHQTVIFDNTDYRPTNLKESTSHYGFGNRFGIYYQQRNAFRQNDRVIFGAMVSLPVNLVSERKLESRIDFYDVTIRPSSYYGDGETTFPLEASAGFSYNPNPFITISTDVLYQNWSDYTNFNGETEEFMKDRIRFGLGGQFVPGRRDASGFLSNFIYRLGVSYDTGNLKLENNDIETFSIHGGISIPSARSNSSIDINAEYGFRGTEMDGLISERIFALKVSFNLSELMFIQRRLQ